jgi:catechol 2,3-dioxygenase-like lactoylglutathione lyase family enzyme
MRSLMQGLTGRAALALLLMAGPGSLPARADSNDAAMLLRTALVVADVERSRVFYELLGFAVESELGGERNPDSPFPVNSRSTRWRLLILASARGEGGRIGLVSFDEASPAPVRPLERERIGLGDAVFVMDMPDALAMHARLVAAGANIATAPATYRSSRLDHAGRPMEGRVFHVFDPDGNLVELLEAPKPIAAR